MLQQKLKFGKWKGYIDIAGFLMEYDDMMEFTFGSFGDTVEFDMNLNTGDIELKKEWDSNH